MPLKTALYQQWKPDGLQEWRALPPTERNGYAWERLHLPGSIPGDQLVLLASQGLLPDPPPFAATERRRLGAPMMVRLTIEQGERLRADAARMGCTITEALRRALG
jgi:hypothetical protein